MMHDNEVIFNDLLKVVFKDYYLHGTEMIEFRNWRKWSKSKGQYMPTSQGVLMEKEVFKEDVLPHLIQWCNED